PCCRSPCGLLGCTNIVTEGKTHSGRGRLYGSVPSLNGLTNHGVVPLRDGVPAAACLGDVISTLNTRHRSRSMERTFSRLSVAGLATLAVVACTDTTGSSNSSLSAAALAGALGAALGAVPVGSGDLTTSFIGAAASDAPSAGLWLAGGREASFDRGGLM